MVRLADFDAPERALDITQVRGVEHRAALRRGWFGSARRRLGAGAFVGA
jgi:hypothetical protein